MKKNEVLVINRVKGLSRNLIIDSFFREKEINFFNGAEEIAGTVTFVSWSQSGEELGFSIRVNRNTFSDTSHLEPGRIYSGLHNMESEETRLFSR